MRSHTGTPPETERSEMDATVNMKMSPHEFELIIEALGLARDALFQRARNQDFEAKARREASAGSTEMANLLSLLRGPK
jgi:hypothetical protein